MASGFDGVLVMVSNPVDVMAWYAWKRSGLPRSQVLGTGTALDTSRLKTIIGEETGLDPAQRGRLRDGRTRRFPVRPVVHGVDRRQAVRHDSSPTTRTVFSSVSLDDLERKTRDRGNAIKDAKGGTNYGIASTVGRHTCRTILWDERRIVPVSTLLDGEYGEHDVFPRRAHRTARQTAPTRSSNSIWTAQERERLHHSAPDRTDVLQRPAHALNGPAHPSTRRPPTMTASLPRMIVADLDGTLLHDADTFEGRFITRRSIDAIHRLHDRGFIFAIATARPVSTGYEFVEKLAGGRLRLPERRADRPVAGPLRL